MREEPRLSCLEQQAEEIFRSVRGKVTENWRKLHHKRMSDVYYLPNITRVIISMNTVWDEHVAHVRKKGNSSMFEIEKLEGKSSLGDLGVDRRLI
jgi:hypothetical protein